MKRQMALMKKGQKQQQIVSPSSTATALNRIQAHHNSTKSGSRKIALPAAVLLLKHFVRVIRQNGDVPVHDRIPEQSPEEQPHRKCRTESES